LGSSPDFHLIFQKLKFTVLEYLVVATLAVLFFLFLMHLVSRFIDRFFAKRRTRKVYIKRDTRSSFDKFYSEHKLPSESYWFSSIFHFILDFSEKVFDLFVYLGSYFKSTFSTKTATYKNTQVAPKWTPEIIQSLESKKLIKLVEGYFEALGYLIKYPVSLDNKINDFFFLHKSQTTPPFGIVKCRAIGSDSVSLKTFNSFYDLSIQNGLFNLVLVTTGGFVEEIQNLIQERKGVNLVNMSKLISLLSSLPVDRQVYLLSEIFLNKNNA